MSNRYTLAGVALAALASHAAPARAANPLPPDESAEYGGATPARFVMGVKFGGGGALWNEPDNTVLGTGENGEEWSLPIFDETRGGYTVSAGMFLQGIFFDHLGLEVGLHFVRHTLLEDIDWEFTETTTGGPGGTIVEKYNAKSEHELTWTALHVPVLIQAVVPTGTTRISLGVGPEFAFHSWSAARFKITEADDKFTADDCNSLYPPKNNEPPIAGVVLPGSRCRLQGIDAIPEDSIYLTVNFGIQIDAGDFIIPIDIHWSYNFSQEPDYDDRVEVANDDIPQLGSGPRHPDRIGLHTRDTMYGGLRIGIAYQF